MAKSPQVTTPTAPAPAPATKAKREAKCKKVYLVNGEDSSHASPDATELQFRFANGNTRKIVLADFPQNIRDAFAWHGASQKLGDTYAQSEDADDAEDKFTNVLELLSKGDWIKVGERVGGAPSNMLSEAYCRYLLAAGKKTPETEEGRAKVHAKVKGMDKAERKSFSESPEIAPHLADIKAERAVAAAQKAAQAAEGASSTVDLTADFE
jgi:hypothetical protein